METKEQMIGKLQSVLNKINHKIAVSEKLKEKREKIRSTLRKLKGKSDSKDEIGKSICSLVKNNQHIGITPRIIMNNLLELEQNTTVYNILNEMIEQNILMRDSGNIIPGENFEKRDSFRDNG